MNITGGKLITRRFFETINDRDLNGLEGLLAPKFVWHGNNDQGFKAYKADLEGIFAAFPDAVWVLEDLFSDGEHVCVRWTFRGTHKGRWETFPETGKRVVYGGISICRIAGGRIAEVWNVENLFGFYRQLGAKWIPP